MNGASGATARPHVSLVDVRSRDRIFYGAMAAALAVVVFAGFGPSYYWTFLNGGPTTTVSGGMFTVVVHLHALSYTAWVLLFIAQTSLVAARRIPGHRRLGIAGGVLAAVMVVTGTTAALEQAARGAAPSGIAPDPLAFLTIPLVDMVLFAGFVTLALRWRRDRESHKRLMLLAYVSILMAAFGRMTIVTAAVPGGAFWAPLLVVSAGMVYDRLTRGRVHRVYVWGLAVLLLSGLRVPLGNTAAWHSFAAWLVG